MKKIIKRTILGLSLPFLIGCSSFKGEYLNIKSENTIRESGYFQTPRGGKATTTDNNRPTFKEANMDKETRLGFETGLILNSRDRLKIEFMPSYQKSKAVLSRDLHTMGKI